MKKRIILGVAVALVAVAGTWLWWQAASPGQSTPAFGGAGGPGVMQAPLVIVAPVQRALLSDILEAIGTTRANESVTVTAKVTETVRNIRFDDGDRVGSGDILVELTDTEETALLAEAEANLSDARRQLRRLEDLVRQGSVPVSQVDEARARAQAQEARFQALTARLDDRLIRAPFSGVLGFRQVSAGTLVTPGTPITTLDDTSVIKLDFAVPEVHLGALAPGQRLVARSAAYPGHEFTGDVSSIGSRIDPVSRTATVRALIPNDDQRLRPGMLMTVRLVTSERESLVVPERATVKLDRREFVFVAEEGHAIRRQITTGARRNSQVEVLSGLELGETIITDGIVKVRDGGPIRTGAGNAAPERGTARGNGGDGGPS